MEGHTSVPVLDEDTETMSTWFRRNGIIVPRQLFWSYNILMPAVGPKREPERMPSRHPIPEVYTLETTGLLVIAILILVLTLVRYWHYIPWSAR